MNKTIQFIIAGLLALVLFFAVNLAANATLRTLRADLTEDKVFTLDEGTKSIVEGIDEPINLYFYLTREQAAGYPEVLEYADRVEGILREYERAADGKIRLSVVDPEPFSEEEDRAVEQGIQSIPLDAGQILYFGLVGTNAMDDREVIPFFSPSPQKQGEVEYDISKLLLSLTNTDKKKVGIVSALQLGGGGGNPMMGQQQAPRWAFLDQLEAYYEVELLAQTPDAEELEDLDCLVVVHPRGFNDETLWRIDQWALSGKPLVMMIDPKCEVDPGAGVDPGNPLTRFTSEKSSNPEKLLSAWGVEMGKGLIACDRVLGVRQQVPSPDNRTVTEIPLVYLLRVGEEEVSKEDPASRLLENLLLHTPGALSPTADATTTFTPLVQTTEESQKVDAAQFQFRPDAQKLLASFVPGFERLTLVARVTGDAESAFPDGEPGAEPDPFGDEDGTDGEGDEPSSGGLKTSAAPLNVVLFADVDMLYDQLWMQVLGRMPNGQPIGMQVSENVDLLRNAIESTLGGKALMSIRVRGRTTRPFEAVEEIQRDANQRNLARKQDLERKLQDAERRLRELQKAQGEDAQELITAEQRKEEELVREEFIQTRRDLRDVQYQLHKDVESLGRRLMLANTALMPFLVFLAALGVLFMRYQGRNR